MSLRPPSSSRQRLPVTVSHFRGRRNLRRTWALSCRCPVLLGPLAMDRPFVASIPARPLGRLRLLSGVALTETAAADIGRAGLPACGEPSLLHMHVSFSRVNQWRLRWNLCCFASGASLLYPSLVSPPASWPRANLAVQYFGMKSKRERGFA